LASESVSRCRESSKAAHAGVVGGHRSPRASVAARVVEGVCGKPGPEALLSYLETKLEQTRAGIA